MSPQDAALMLPATLVIGIWVAWSDMKYMKIPNMAVLALLGVWVVLGLLILPFSQWAIGLGLGAALLVIGFFAALIRFFGAGDAKFIAAMAPFFVQSNLRFVLVMGAGALLAAFFTHRLAKIIPPLRRQTQDWQSWTRADFPMGFALAGILNIHIVLLILPMFLP